MRVAIDFRNFYDAGTKSLIEKRMEKIDRAARHDLPAISRKHGGA